MPPTTRRQETGDDSTPPAGDNTLAATTSTFDGFGRTATSGTGLRGTTYVYDQDGRVLSAAHSDNTPALITSYDANGRVLATTDANGTVTTTYTALGQVKTSVRNGATPANTTYTYDPTGHLTSMADGRGTTRYHYDKLGLLDQLSESGGAIDLFGYNQDHQRTDTYYNTSGTNGAAATYDASGNNLQAPAGFAVHSQSILDQGGRLTETKTTRASSNTTVAADISYCYSKYTAGQPCPGGTVSSDRAQRQYSTDLLTGAVTVYTYDQGGRLKTAVTTGGPLPATYGYCYDADGNRLLEGTSSINCSAPPAHTYNSVNQLTSDGAAYDVDGNQTTPAPLTTTSYSSGDQATSFTPASQGSLAATYGGNGQGDRLSFGTTSYANGIQGLLSATTGGASTYYERDPSGTLISERGPGGEFYYVTDGLGSTVALVDTAGMVQATYTYDPYGITTVGGPNPAIAGGNPYRYAGGYYDTATRLYHFGQRYYNPTTGRWTQQDSLNTPLNPTNGNRYAYTGDDPINGVDLNGTFPSSVLGFALDFVSSTIRAGNFVGSTLDGGAAAAFSDNASLIADAVGEVAQLDYLSGPVIREQLFNRLASLGYGTAETIADAIAVAAFEEI